MTADPEIVAAAAEAIASDIYEMEAGQKPDAPVEPNAGDHSLAVAAVTAIEPLIALRTMKQYADGLDAWEKRIRADERHRLATALDKAGDIADSVDAWAWEYQAADFIREQS